MSRQLILQTLLQTLRKFPPRRTGTTVTKLLVLVVLLVILNFVSAQTYVSGIISSGSTWTVSESPYIITGNTMIDDGVTLTIEPGATIKFDGNYFLRIQGTLIAEGTLSDSILFTSNYSSPSKGDWDKIEFQGSSDDSNCVIKYAIIEYATTGIYINDASPEVTNNTISHCSIGGISWMQGITDLRNNTIDDIGSQSGTGLYVSGNNSTTINISDNFFSNIRGDGIRLSNNNSCSINVSDNNISHVSVHIGRYTAGIYISQSSSDIVITNNSISGSKNTYYDGQGIYCDGSVNNLTINGNTFTGNNNGLRLNTNDKPVTISNNTIAGSTHNGMILNAYSTNVTISNNTLTDNAQGIYWTGNSNYEPPIINFNNVINTTGYALYVNTYKGTYTTLNAKNN